VSNLNSIKSCLRTRCKLAFTTTLCLVAIFVIISQVLAGGRTNGLKSIMTMHEMRASHTATLLPNGKVLIVGGFKKVRTYDQVYFNSAELYDPQTNTFGTTGKLNVARCGHTATLLGDGTVLIVGGGNNQPLASAELYDPRSGTFVPVGMMAASRQGHTATLLKDGNVLIVGGRADGRTQTEIFNVKVKRFEVAGNLTMNRSGHTATSLSDGRVFVAGGADQDGKGYKVLASAELYDPATGKFTSTGNMTMVRYKHAATLLADSTVLIVGGSNEHDWTGQYNTAEVYDPRLGKFVQTNKMEGKRFKLPNAVALLNDNTVLIAGGGTKVEVYNYKAGTFTSVAQFDEPHFYSTATRLLNGNVLIAGGYNTKPQSTDMAWIYDMKE
jgi:WD40 repeat protein